MNIKYIDKKLINETSFAGVKSSTREVDLTYYFNQRRYPNQTAFSFGMFPLLFNICRRRLRNRRHHHGKQWVDIRQEFLS